MYEILDIDANDLFAEMGVAVEAEILHASKMMVDGVYVASSGVSRVPDGDGRLWGFLDIKEPQTPDLGMVIVRAMRRFLRFVRRYGQDIYIQCERDDAERFLKILGFVKTEELSEDLRNGKMLGVWVWRH